MKFIIALWFAKFVNVLINIVDKTRGSSLSGEKALKIDPRMLEHFKGIDYSKVLFITGTNGKSTTTNLITHIFRSQGYQVISNLEGANLIYGVATSLIKASSLTGRVKADFFIFETDERYLPYIHEQIPAENIIVTNLQKDQVQRNGDPDYIYRKIKSVMNKNLRVFLNNEEPRSKSFDDLVKTVVTYGLERHVESFTKDDSFPTMPCPKCKHKIVFDYYNTDSVGKFHCSNCGHSSDETPNYLATDVNFDAGTLKIQGVDFNMPYDTPYMLYNYVGAVAVAKELGNISPEDSAKVFGSFKNVGGRFEELKYGNKTIRYMRVKQENPETLQTIINVIASDPKRKMVCLGLGPVLDITPYYANTFYAFDCDFSKIVKSDVEKFLCFADTVCFDTVNRLLYEGVDKSLISINDTEEIDAILSEIDKAETDNVYLITRLHIFECMQSKIEKECK